MKTAENEFTTWKISVIGAGRWGTAMAIYLSRKGLDVTLQSHSEETYQYLLDNDRSPRLPQFSCDRKIKFVQDLESACKGADLIILSVPVPFLRQTLQQMNDLGNSILVGINKGIERNTLLTVPEIVAEFFPQQRFAQLSGPCFPEGLLSDSSPAAETIACNDEPLAIQLQSLFNSRFFRVYRSSDLYGASILGALKNVFAIGAGMAEGMGFSEEAISVLVTRGLAEMKRFCEVKNISMDTLYGLSGLGDLMLTCYSPSSSHNKNFGKKIGQGMPVTQVLEELHGSIAEGYFTAQAANGLVQKHFLDLPLIETIYRVLYENLPLREGLLELLDRPLKTED